VPSAAGPELLASSAAALRRPRWVLVAGVAGLLSLLAFALVTMAIYGHGPLLTVDTGVEQRFASHRMHWLIRFFAAETHAGSFYVAAPFLLLVAAVVTIGDRSWRPLLLGVTALMLLAVSVGTGKQVIGRSRIPFAANAFGDGGTSYPSGHATTAVVVSGCLVLLFARHLTALLRRLGLLLVAAFSLLTGFSRIYLHAHWFTDVLAGWLLGTAIVCLLAVVFLGVPGLALKHGAQDRQPQSRTRA
jgi:membrane-associated phospholipid phosphatase